MLLVMHSIHSRVDGTTEQYVLQTWHSMLETFEVKVTDHPSFVECS